MTENMDENGKEEIDCREEKLNYSNKGQGKTKKLENRRMKNGEEGRREGRMKSRKDRIEKTNKN